MTRISFPGLATPPLALLFLLTLGLQGCGDGETEVSDGSPAPRTRVTLTGSSTMAPVVLEIAKGFEARNPAIRIDVQTGGSGRGIRDARTGTADIGMASRELKPGEDGLRTIPLARDGLAFITHANNPVKNLTREQIRRIYLGETGNWRDVGGPDQVIVLVHKAEGRGTLDMFLTYFELDNTKIKPDVIVGDNAQGVKTVAGSAGAIGYVSLGPAQAAAEEGTAIRLLDFDGRTPTLTGIERGEYPVSRNLNFILGKDPEGAVKDFIGFALSEDSQAVIRSFSFSPVASPLS